MKLLLDAIAYCHKQGVVHRDLKVRETLPVIIAKYFITLSYLVLAGKPIIDIERGRCTDKNSGFWICKAGRLGN